MQSKKLGPTTLTNFIGLCGLVGVTFVACESAPTTQSDLRSGSAKAVQAPVSAVPNSNNAVAATPANPLPQTIADFGLFTNGQIDQPGPNVYPYNVEVSLWSDGAAKQRFLYVPPGQTITLDPSGNNQFVFPAGTTLFKHFSRAANNVEPIETRVIRFNADGTYSMMTYQWAADGTATQQPNLTDVAGTDPAEARYRIPANQACLLCHYASAGTVLLGSEPNELNFALAGGTNQLDALAQAPIFGPGVLAAAAAISARPNPLDPTLNVGQQARAYMDLNCATCHNPNGSNSILDLSLATGDPTQLARQRDIGPDGVTSMPMITPGDPQNSLIYQRITASTSTPNPNAGHMPPQSLTADPLALQLLTQWITGLQSVNGIVTYVETTTTTTTIASTSSTTTTLPPTTTTIMPASTTTTMPASTTTTIPASTTTIPASTTTTIPASTTTTMPASTTTTMPASTTTTVH